jgi:hypothetical protein
MSATWCTLGTLCRARDWSKRRLLHELQNGLPYRTIPEGDTIDWANPIAERSLDLEASTMKVYRGMRTAKGSVFYVGGHTVGIEALPPTNATTVSPSVRWAIATTRTLRGENKLPQDTTKAELARLLEAEAQRAVKDGKLGRALKASYLENQLISWGIWPLSSFK